MRPWRLVTLAVVVLAVASYIYFVERHAPTTDEVKERANKVFPSLDQAKLKRLVVTNTHGRFELVRDKEDWKLVSPLADDANQSSVTSLLGSLTALTSERTLEVKDLKLADYGLASPTLKLEATQEDGSPIILQLGSEMPLGNTRAALAGGEQVFLVNKYIAADLEKDLAGWRSDQLVRIYATDVASANITLSGVRLALAHTGSIWTLTEPVTDLADRERIEGVINDLGAARIKEFVDNPPALSTLGLDPGKLEVTLLRRAEGATPLVFSFGNEREVGGVKEVACRRGDRVFWVEATAVKGLQGEPREWRASKLVQLDTWSVDSLDIDAGAAKAGLVRKEGVWRAGDAEVDFTAVSGRLNALAELQVLAFDQPKPAGQALGSVKAAVADGPPVEVTFHPGSLPAQALAVVTGRSGAMTVDRTKVDELLADPAGLTKPRATPTPSPSATPAT